MKTIKRISILLLLGMLPAFGFCQEGEVTIVDSSGFTRAVSQIDGVGIVEFDLVDASGNPAEGIEVTLTNSATGETMTVASVNGTATFQGVQSGSWTVASAASQVTFTNVAISSGLPLVAGGAGLGAVAGGTAVFGGVTAAAVNRANDDDDQGDVLSPSS